MSKTPYRLVNGDCKVSMQSMPDASIGSIVTDPPYGLSRDPDIGEVLRHWEAGTPYAHGGAGFMGKAWDSFVPNPDVWREAYRVLKPGGYLLAFAGTRTVGLMATSIEMAGFQVCGRLHYLYGSGFPKSLNLGKSIDKAAGAERERTGRFTARHGGKAANKNMDPFLSKSYDPETGKMFETAPATDLAKQWEGWGTALKPAYEPIVVAYKPYEDGTGPSDHREWVTFKYSSKASKEDRNAGCRDIPAGNNLRVNAPRVDEAANLAASYHNNHPTVKPDTTMQWLVSLQGIQGPILDPYMGSGSTGKAVGMVRPDTEFVGVELDPHYYEIARARVLYGYGDTHRLAKKSRKIDSVLQQEQEEMYLSILGFK